MHRFDLQALEHLFKKFCRISPSVGAALVSQLTYKVLDVLLSHSREYICRIYCKRHSLYDKCAPSDFHFSEPRGVAEEIKGINNYSDGSPI